MLGIWLLLCAFLGLMVLFGAAVQNWGTTQNVKLKGRRVGDKWFFSLSGGSSNGKDLFWLAATDPEHEG